MSRMADFIQEYVEMVEKEFKELEHEELFTSVWDLMTHFGLDFFLSLNKIDKYDYLVDSIMQGYIDDMWVELHEQKKKKIS